MIYDCFPFFNELDLLEIRLNVLKDAVDRFVIVEAPWTFTGIEKPLVFSKNKDRFKPFLDRIIYVVAGEPPVSQTASHRENAWIRENFQRNEILRGLKEAKPNDTIILSDLDEIPDPEAIAMALKLPGVTRFRQRFYNFFLNYRNYSVPYWPMGTQLCSFSAFKDPSTYKGVETGEFVVACANSGATMTKLRMAKPTRTIKKGGWHFSYLGGIEAIQQKLKSFAHTECNTTKTTDTRFIAKSLDSGRDPVERGYRFFREPINDAFPLYIRENASHYSKLILPMTANCGWRTWFPKVYTILRGKAYRAMVVCIPNWLVPFALRVRSWMYRRRTNSALNA